MDSIRESRDNATKQLQNAADSAAEFLDDGLASATHAAKQSVAVVRDNAEQALQVGQVRCFDVVAHEDPRWRCIPVMSRSETDIRCPVVQSYWDTAVAHFQHSREQVFDKIKGGFTLCCLIAWESACAQLQYGEFPQIEVQSRSSCRGRAHCEGARGDHLASGDDRPDAHAARYALILVEHLSSLSATALVHTV